MSNTLFPWMRKVFNTAALQTSGLAVAELYNPGSRVWDANRARANAPPDRSSIPSTEVPHGLAWVAGSTGSCCRELLALPPSPASHLHPLTPLSPSQRARVCPVSSDMAYRDETKASRCHRQPAPRQLPPDRARGASSQPFPEPVSAALITSAVWIALLGH